LARLKAEVTAIPRGIAAILRRGKQERDIGHAAAAAAHARAANKGATLGQPAAKLTTREKKLTTGETVERTDLVGPRGRRAKGKEKKVKKEKK
jgi:hypothetical protein